MPTRDDNNKRLLFRFSLFFAGILLLDACAPFRHIEVKDFVVDNVMVQGQRILIDFSATVNNPNRSFVIHSAGGDIHLGERPFAVAQLLQAIAVPARAQERCSGQLQLTIKDLFAALQLGLDYKSWDWDAFLFSGGFQVKSAWMKKNFNYREVPLSQLMNTLQ